jgi:hypothetical protein
MHERSRRKIDDLQMACDGRFTESHAQMCRLHLDAHDHLTAQIAGLGQLVAEAAAPFAAVIARLVTIPGIGPRTAEVIVAETGGLRRASTSRGTPTRARLNIGSLATADQSPSASGSQSGGAPLTADGTGARLPDVDPRCDVDLLKVELEQRIARRGLDHPADAASRHDTADERRGVDVGGDVCRGRPDAQLIVVGAWHGVDHAAGISPQVMSLRRRARDGGEQTAARDDRAEGMKARGAVWPYRGQVGDGKRRCAGGDGLAAGQSDDAGPQAACEGGYLSCLGLEPRPRGHAIHHDGWRAEPPGSARAKSRSANLEPRHWRRWV